MTDIRLIAASFNSNEASNLTINSVRSSSPLIYPTISYVNEIRDSNSQDNPQYSAKKAKYDSVKGSVSNIRA